MQFNFTPQSYRHQIAIFSLGTDLNPDCEEADGWLSLVTVAFVKYILTLCHRCILQFSIKVCNF